MSFEKDTIARHLTIFYTPVGIAVAFLLVAAPGATAAEKPFSYEDYAEILAAYVDDRGMVNYAALKEHRGRLDAFVQRIADLTPSTYDKWNDSEKIAFWINAYNALTLRAIVDHYPIKPGLLSSFRFPKNSIRQIPGVWDKLQFKVMGRQMTLDGIEHDTLRSKFDEPRIHLALVCAAMGCPPLRNEPFTGAKLELQLSDQTMRFLKDPDKFRIDGTGGYVYLSSIFKWFGEDFIKNYGTDKFTDRGPSERAVLKFLGSSLKGRDKEFLEAGKYEIIYLAYDWVLNEKGAGQVN
ncbi:MAG: DUF547 domain-containing protein [Desulfomonile tiedjei]|nr:DUF547 domain-containing protein [Desulfomonile tiedjei]